MYKELIVFDLSYLMYWSPLKIRFRANMIIKENQLRKGNSLYLRDAKCSEI